LACRVALSLTTSDERADEGGVGHCNQQLTGDSGAGAVLGDISRVRTPSGRRSALLSGRQRQGLRESARLLESHGPPARGWNVWLTGGLPFGAGRGALSAQRLLRALGERGS